MQKTRKLIYLFLMFVLLNTSYSFGQYRLLKDVVGMGGSEMSNSEFQVKGTISQTVIGTAENDEFSAKIGFWYEILPVYNTTIHLGQGWNTISSFIAPTQASMERIWENANQLVIVKNSSGNFYYPSLQINTIGNWNQFEGYQCYVTAPFDLLISGSRINPQTPINLSVGWNLIAYIKDTEMPIENALSSLGNSLLIAKDNSGNIYFPSAGLNTIGNMVPGQGYLIYMLSADTLIYPE